MVMKNLAF